MTDEIAEKVRSGALNIDALDGGLRFGDATQIAVVKAMEAGYSACEHCGLVYERPEWRPLNLCDECVATCPPGESSGEKEHGRIDDGIRTD